MISCIVVRHVCHAVDDRIAHVHIGTGHVDLRAERLLAVLKSAVLHHREELKILFHAPVAVGVVLTGFLERAAVLPHLLRCEVGDIGFPFFDQLHCDLIHLIEVIGGKIEPVLVIGAQPVHVLLDRLHELALLLGGIGVVKAEIEFAAIFLRHSVVEQNALGMSDVKIPVRLGGKACVHGRVYTFRKVFVNFFLYKVTARLLL